MKADERKHLEENELQHWLTDAWSSVTSGSTVNTIIWGLVVLGLVLYIGWRQYANTTAKTRSASWEAFELADSPPKLESVVQEYPETTAARMANFNLSRVQMQDAMTRVAGPIRAENTQAADMLEKVKKRYLDLAKDSADEPSLVQEALTNAAKIEETLCGLPKEADKSQPRGSLDAAVKLYDELAKRYPKAFLGERAAARSKEIADRRPAFDALYRSILKEIAPPPAPPAPTLPPTPIVPTPEAPKPAEPPKPEDPKPKN